MISQHQHQEIFDELDSILEENKLLRGWVAELEKRLIAPTDNGIVDLDNICEKFNSNKDSTLNALVCGIWNKAYFEALKEGNKQSG